VGDGVTEAKPKPKISWTEANQAYLVAEFAWLKGLLRAGDKRGAPSAKKARAAIKPPAAIDRLTELFNLSGFERAVLLLCAGVEMDSELAGLCGEAQGRPPRATFGLTMALLPDPHWSALGSARPLRHFRMIELDGGAGLTSAPLHLDERASCIIWPALTRSTRACSPFCNPGTIPIGSPTIIGRRPSRR
jgi:hypothetical protein